MKITTNFSLEEMTDSRQFPELVEKNRAEAMPYLSYLEQVCEQLQILRDYIARPVIVTSGFRCPELNAACRGAKHSAHTQGRAADFTVKDFQDPAGLMGIYRWCADNLKGAQLIFEHPKPEAAPWIHLGLPHDKQAFALPLERLLFVNGVWSKYDE